MVCNILTAVFNEWNINVNKWLVDKGSASFNKGRNDYINMTGFSKLQIHPSVCICLTIFVVYMSLSISLLIHVLHVDYYPKNEGFIQTNHIYVVNHETLTML